MVYFKTVATQNTAVGPQNYHAGSSFYKTSCGCGSGSNFVNVLPQAPMREGFNNGNARMNGNGNMGNGNMGNGNMPAPYRGNGNAAPMCTLTATAPPAGCCNPAPLHCDCCNGSGFFRASEAYGS